MLKGIGLSGLKVYERRGKVNLREGVKRVHPPSDSSVITVENIVFYCRKGPGERSMIYRTIEITEKKESDCLRLRIGLCINSGVYVEGGEAVRANVLKSTTAGSISQLGTW